MKKLILIILLFNFAYKDACNADFEQKCNALPENPICFQNSAVSFEEFSNTAEQFKSVSSKELSNKWLNKEPSSDWITTNNPSFIPFAQKAIVDPGSSVAFFGDLHGSIHSLLRNLKTLQKQGFINSDYKIIKPNFYIAFLGDFVDRGFYGVEVLYTIMSLKIKNPNNIFIARGNHEDMGLNLSYGFHEELQFKFGNINVKPIYRVYDFMSPVIFLGCKNKKETNYVQCCHGGLEVGYNPKNLLKSDAQFELIESINRKNEINKLSSDIKRKVRNTLFEFNAHKELCNFVATGPTTFLQNFIAINLGFMWSDFIPNNPLKALKYTPNRGWVYGKDLTKEILNNYSTQSNKVRCIFRAHQHHGEMLKMLRDNNGIVSLWDGLVYTFLSAPLNDFKFPYDSMGILTVNESFQEWKLKHIVTDALQ